MASLAAALLVALGTVSLLADGLEYEQTQLPSRR
jgi:hypothetical protein